MPPTANEMKKRLSKTFEGLGQSFKGALARRRGSNVDEPEKAGKMRNLDKDFFGEEDEEDDDRPKAAREGTGLLDDEPERAETDFYNGDKYVGDVQNGKRHGHGVYYYDSGDKYTGNWNMGKQEGHGVYVYANGDRYVGEWFGGKHDGAGTYYFKSGKIFQGTYRNGSPSGYAHRAATAPRALSKPAHETFPGPPRASSLFPTRSASSLASVAAAGTASSCTRMARSWMANGMVPPTLSTASTPTPMAIATVAAGSRARSMASAPITL